jgi:predicted PurR-regulated permease PerM
MDSSPPVTSPPWQPRTKRIVALIVFGLALLALWRLSGTLSTIVVGLILAYLLYPVTNFFTKTPTKPFGVGRGFAVLLTFIFVILLVVVVVLVVVPSLARQFAAFAENVPAALARVEADLELWLSQPVVFNNEPILIDGHPLIPLEEVRTLLGREDILQLDNVDLSAVAQTFFNSLIGVTRPAFSFLGTAFSALINGVFFLTMLFYLLKDGGMFVERTVSVVPEEYQGDARRLFYELGQVWNSYLRGQLILSTFVGIMVFISASILGVPNALVLALISFTLEFIPTIGPTIALIPAALLALFSTSSTIGGLNGVVFAVVVIVVWLVIQNIQQLFVTPRVMGDSLNLHPFVILLAVLAGASFGGALGVILAAPMVATIRLFGQYIYGKIFEKNPFPEPRSEQPAVPPFIMRLWNRLRTPAAPRRR